MRSITGNSFIPGLVIVALGVWQQRVKDTFDFAALASLVKQDGPLQRMPAGILAACGSMSSLSALLPGR